MMRRLTPLVLASALLTACSSDNSSGSSGSSASSFECSFTGSLTGGVTGTITANGCGTTSSESFTIAQADLGAGTSLGAKFVAATALKGGELGAIPLARFEIFQREGKGTTATSLVWSSTSCTLTLDKNEASPTSVFKNRFLLAGRGSCSAPLEPTAPNTRPAVTVSAFEMTAFIDP